jgi:peptidoglycan/LPS O-acetylase OafA/YrhL
LASAGGYVSIYDQPWHPIFNTPSFIANLFLVQAWNLFNYLSWNGVAWFVSVEFLLCLLFPFYLLLASGRAWRGVALVALGVAGLVTLNLTSAHGLDLTFHNGIYRGMSAFAVGIGLSAVFRAVKLRDRKRLPEAVHSIVQLFLLGALLYGIYETGWSHSHRDILTVLPMMALVLALAFDRGLLAVLLKTSIPMKLGEWSYAIYIGQTAWLQFLHFIEQRLYPAPSTVVLGHRWPDLIHWVEPAALVAVCIAWGAFLAIAIEQPASALLKRVFDTGRPLATTPIHEG